MEFPWILHQNLPTNLKPAYLLTCLQGVFIFPMLLPTVKDLRKIYLNANQNAGWADLLFASSLVR